eukprot:5387679-Prymnesium_polylepis.1
MQTLYDIATTQSFYNILKVHATPKQIKKAYHKLALLYHPDKNHGDATKMTELNEAYATLTDDLDVHQAKVELEAAWTFEETRRRIERRIEGLTRDQIDLLCDSLKIPSSRQFKSKTSKLDWLMQDRMIMGLRAQIIR